MQQRLAEKESLLVVIVKRQRHLHDQQRWTEEEGRLCCRNVGGRVVESVLVLCLGVRRSERFI